MKIIVNDTYSLEKEGIYLTLLKTMDDTIISLGTSMIDNIELIAKIMTRDILRNKRITTEDYIREFDSAITSIKLALFDKEI